VENSIENGVSMSNFDCIHQWQFLLVTIRKM